MYDYRHTDLPTLHTVQPIGTVSYFWPRACVVLGIVAGAGLALLYFAGALWTY
jgi:hypothetical protein